MNFESVVNQINSLPPLSNATSTIQQLYTEGAENVDIIKLVKIIESDAVLTVNVLKMINAPAYGFSKKIASVAQAVTLFGTEIMYGIVMRYSIFAIVKADTSAYGISTTKFNIVCQIQSALMMQWFAKIDLRHAQFLTPLALVMEAGKLILAKEIAESDYTLEFKEGLKRTPNIEKYEISLIDMSSYDLTALLFEHWNLEPLYIEMLKGLDLPDYEDDDFQMTQYIKTLRVIRTAVNVREILTLSSIEKACRLVEEMDLDSDHFRHVVARIKQSYANAKKPK